MTNRLAPLSAVASDAGASRWRAAASRVAPALIVLLALVLRCVGLTSESLWFDEGHSVLVARMGASEAVASLARDVHPPLYFLTLRAWIRAFGESDVSLRSLSVLFGVVAVGGVLALGRRIGGPRAGLVAGLLAAVSPYFVAYSQEVRPYALLFALSVLSTLALLRLVDRPGSMLRRAVYAVSLASLPYTHALGLFVGLTHALYVLVRVVRPRPDDSPRLLRAALVAGVGALALFAPWAPSFLRQEASVRATGWIAPPHWKEFHRAVLAHAGGEFAFATLAALALVGLGRAPRRPHPDRPRLLGGLLWAIPLLVPAGVSLIGPAIFLPRTTIASAAGLFLLAGLGACQIADAGAQASPTMRKIRGALSVAIVIAALAFSGRTLFVQMEKPKNTDFRGAITLVEERARPGDGIVVGHRFEGTIAEHYLRRTDLPILAAFDAPPATAKSLWVIVTIHTEKVRQADADLARAGFRPTTIDRLHRVEVHRYDR